MPICYNMGIAGNNNAARPTQRDRPMPMKSCETKAIQIQDNYGEAVTGKAVTRIESHESGDWYWWSAFVLPATDSIREMSDNDIAWECGAHEYTGQVRGEGAYARRPTVKRSRTRIVVKWRGGEAY